MSYESENRLPSQTNITSLLELVRLLGYQPTKDKRRIEDQIGSFYWFETSDYMSWSGVQLHIYKSKFGILVHTRTSSSCSYWDLKHQNATIKVIKKFFGGIFATDAGKGRYFQLNGTPPSAVSSGCYLARWRFHNSLGRAENYLQAREFKGNSANDQSSGLLVIDQFNPKLLSNNLLIPYVFAIWEEYFRSTFAAILKYAESREAVLKKARLSHTQLEQIATERGPIEEAIAECFSFQRPSAIGNYFKLIDPKLDIAAAMRRPYRQRRVTLYDSIESFVEKRNALVHTGEMDLAFFDKELKGFMKDIVLAVDRAYDAIGTRFKFRPIRDY